MKKTVIALAVASTLLTGCVPALLVGAGTATGAALGRDSRTLQTITDDTDIQFQINQKLSSDPQTAKGSAINVMAFNRIVLLTGEAPSEAVRAAAEADAQKIPKVRRIYNLIQVSPEIGIIQLGDDTRISTNIKARLMVTSDLNSDNFKYTVNNRIVYLMGLASHAQTKLALDVIRNSAGVTKVVNLVEYTDDVNGASASSINTASGSAVATTPAAPTATPTVATTAPASSTVQAANGTAAFVPTTTT